MDQLVGNLDLGVSDDLLIGLDPSDDAAVYRIDENRALVFTADVITPVVDDPYLWGQVAAANSLSDIFAMGGEVLMAINLAFFPTPGESITTQELEQVLRGGNERVRSAGGLTVGGHTVRDSEIKYGLAVVGEAHPDRILTKSGARAEDVLILTKPLGTGLIIGAYTKQNENLSSESVEEACHHMKTLNDTAAQLSQEYGVSGATDVTGFGLLGHAWEMASRSGVDFHLKASLLPHYEICSKLVASGVQTGVTRANEEATQEHVRISPELNELQLSLLFDPQTSGGLLISVARDNAKALLADLHKTGLYPHANIIGEVHASTSPKMEIQT